MAILIGSFACGIAIRFVGAHGLLRRWYQEIDVPCWRRRWGRARHLIVGYLLIHIGLIGGVEVAAEGVHSLIVPGILSIVLAVSLFMIALLVVNRLRVGDRDTQISLAAHFGSVSVGTFAAAQAFLARQEVAFAGSTSAWLALMEIPAILVAALVLGGGLRSVRRILHNREIWLLIGSLVIGATFGTSLLDMLKPIIVMPFEWVLALFLLDMGQQAGIYLAQQRNSGARLVAFGLIMPLSGGLLGAFAGTLAGMSVGDVALLSTLSASSSYVAATAAMKRMVSPYAVATSLSVSLGITLPWNLVIGIPLYLTVAQALQHAVRSILLLHVLA